MQSDIQSLVGQSIMFRFMGPIFTTADRALFNRIRPGGVLYFGDNLTSFAQVQELSAQLQEAAREEGMPPLFIAADQEGGIVTRFPVDMVTVASAMAVGALPDDVIRKNAKITARQLRAVGINTNFAPTIDINSNPLNPVIRTRSFGEDVETVTRAGLASIAGIIDENVMPTVKHFPGHGNTQIDSHHGLPVIETSIEDLHKVELAPFKAAIAAGVPAIMTAHIRFPALDDLPATLSKRILTGLLRDELGYTGLIYTDSMCMDAITRGWGVGEASILAKEAGVDVLESSEGPEMLAERHAALVDAVESGRLCVDTFTSTMRRLEDMRFQFDVSATPKQVVDMESVREDAIVIARDSLRTASNGAVPTIPDRADTVVLQFARLRNLEIVDRFDLPSVMERAIEDKLPHATMITLHSDPTEPEIQDAIQLVSGARTLVVCTRDAIQHSYQVDIAKRILAATSSSATRIHVNLRGPYDTGLVGDVDETVFTFGDAVVSLRALASAFAGC